MQGLLNLAYKISVVIIAVGILDDWAERARREQTRKQGSKEEPYQKRWRGQPV